MIRVASVAVLCFGLMPLIPAAPAAPAPKAAIPDARFNFEATLSGSTVEHDFILKNLGSAPLQIQKVSMTPPLLATSMPGEIPAGSEGKIHFQLDTSHLSGAFQGEIVVFVDDPAQPEIELAFEGRVVPLIEIVPMPAFFVAAQRGESKRASVEILSHAAEPLTIQSIEHSTERFTTELETIEPGRHYRLTLVLRPDGPMGRTAETIRVRTSSESEPVLPIQANIFMHGRVYTFPDTVDLGAFRMSEIRRDPRILEWAGQTLMIHQAGGTDFEAKITTDVPFLRLKAERGPRGDQFQVSISLDSSQVCAGPIKGSLLVETNDPDFPKIVVPVVGQILEP